MRLSPRSLGPSSRYVRLVTAGALLALAGSAAGCTATSTPQASREPAPSASASVVSEASADPTASASAVASAQPSESTPTADGAGEAVSSDNAPVAVPAAKPDRCHTAGLRARIDRFEPAGKAGGSQDALLWLTNVGSAPCALYGYPGLQMLEASGRPKPTSVNRYSAEKRALLVLAPNQSAWSQIAWFFTPDPGEENTEPLCGPTATRAQVTPPDETTHLVVDADFGTVCGGGGIDVLPLSLEHR
jgi:hypothetical protein